ncbi:MAG: hemolysin family protein [bacterium]|nr:hemolysin family protein [bacterium]
MKSPLLFLSLSLLGWIALVALAGLFATVASAVSHLHIRDLLKRNDPDHTAINRWLRWAPSIHAAAIIWHALTLISAAILALPLATYVAAFMPPYLHYLPHTLAPIILLICACLLPLYLGYAYPEPFSIRLLPFLHPWAALTRFLNRILLACALLPLRIFRVNLHSDAPFLPPPNSPLPPDASSNPLEREEHQMIKSIFEFGETLVRAVMTPRTEMVAVPASCSLDEAIHRSQHSGHSRLPVYEDDLDHIIGVLYVRDALAFWSSRHSAPPALTDIMRAPFFVPETKKVNELLREFRQLKTQLAVIVDEYGGTSGLVTLEDLIEEIVGDLSDEYDREPSPPLRQLDHDTFIVDGALSVYDLNDALNIHIPVAPDFDTLAGYIMSKLGRVPAQGEQIVEHDYILTVLSVNQRRIEQVKVSRRSSLDSPPSPPLP